MPYTQVRASSDTGRGPSPQIWAGAPIDIGMNDPGRGRHLYDDFLGFAPITIAAPQTQLYKYFADTDGTLVFLDPNASGGVGMVQFGGNSTDNDEAQLTYGEVSGFYTFGKTNWCGFECRFKTASVADDGIGYFIGATSIGNAAADTLTDTDAALKATSDFVGWHVTHDDGDSIKPVYQEASATPVNPGTAQTLVAATWTKVGFRFDGRRCEWMFNGNIVAEVTVDSSIDFPDTNSLCMMFATKLGAGAEVLTDLDWWRCACDPAE